MPLANRLLCVFLFSLRKHFVSPIAMMQISKYLNYCKNSVYHSRTISILHWLDSKQQAISLCNSLPEQASKGYEPDWEGRKGCVMVNVDLDV